MAPRIRVNKLGEPLMPVTGWVPVKWHRAIARMAQDEDIRSGKAGVVETSLREALERRGLLGDTGRPTMRREAAARNPENDPEAETLRPAA